MAEPGTEGLAKYRRGTTTLIDRYTDSLCDACADLASHRDTFTDYSAMLLDELCDFAASIDGLPLRELPPRGRSGALRRNALS